MASQVFSGRGNFSYTNNTGQNVRIIINFIQCRNNNVDANDPTGSGSTRDPRTIYGTITFSWAGVSIPLKMDATTYTQTNIFTVGRNLGFLNVSTVSGGSGSNLQTISTGVSANNMGAGDIVLPTEIMLAPSQSFSITQSTISDFRTNVPIVTASVTAYNIVVIPEGG